MQDRKLRLIPGKRQWHILREETDVSDWELDWSRYLTQSESISTVSTSATNCTVDSSSVSGQTTTHFISGGNNEAEGHIDVTIVTNNATARKFRVRLRVKTSNYAGSPKVGMWQ